MSFVHLHTRSDHSLLDSACTVDNLVRTAAEDAQPAIALTDRGLMGGVPELFRACKEHGIQPVAGCEVSLIGRASDPRTAESGLGEIPLLAAGPSGYRSLCEISTAGYRYGYARGHPHVDCDVLASHSEGVIALTGGRRSKICSSAAAGQLEDVRLGLRQLVDVLGPRNVYVELPLDGTRQEQGRNTALAELARSMGLSIVATADVHYLTDSDRRTYAGLRALADGSALQMTERGMGAGRFAWRSSEEMHRAFANLPEALTATLEIAERCQLELAPTFGLPRALPGFLDEEAVLRDRVLAGLVERVGGAVSAAAHERADRELGAICSAGLAPYFLIWADMLVFAREQKIEYGPGRGPAGGSIVCFALRITDVDPLEHRLSFERFLDPDRAGWEGQRPDIDVDFSVPGRKHVVEFLSGRFGGDRGAGVVTHGRFYARGAVRAAAEVLGHPVALGDRLARLIPDPTWGRPPSLASCLQDGQPLASAACEDPAVQQIVELARGLEGKLRSASMHAAARVIGDVPLASGVPLRRVEDVQGQHHLVTQYSMRDAELLGLLTLDVLGLNDLTVIEDALGLIEAHTGTRPDLRRIPLDDPSVYDGIGRGAPVFHLIADAAQAAADQIQPDCLADLAALISMTRPSAEHLIPEYADRKRARRRDEDGPLTTILADTYGLLLYQEQIMDAAVTLAGFTGSQANDLRRAFGKLNRSDIATFEPKFIDGCTSTGIDAVAAARVFASLRTASDWAFNRAHAVSYAFITYRCLWLKAHHPAEYLAARLRWQLTSNPDPVTTEKHLEALRRHAAQDGVTVIEPHVNDPILAADVIPRRITLGLALINGLTRAGHLVSTHHERGPFSTAEDVRARVPLSGDEWQALERAGAVRGLPTRSTPRTKRVLDAVDMVALVSDHVELRRKSSDLLVGTCPFHSEQSPSFSLWPDEKRWHCFGCGAGGDAFDFVMDAEDVSFEDAIRLLADRFGPSA